MSGIGHDLQVVGCAWHHLPEGTGRSADGVGRAGTGAAADLDRGGEGLVALSGEGGVERQVWVGGGAIL